jgi:hypothetical protein
MPYFCHQRWAGFICEKYIHSPHSTDFAGLFLPTKGLFAELSAAWPCRCPSARVAHHGGRAHHPSLVIGVAPGWLPIAGNPKALKRSLEGIGGGEDGVWEIRRYPRQGQQEAARDPGGAGQRSRGSSSGDGIANFGKLEVLPEGEAVSVRELDGPELDEGMREAAE